MKMIKNVLYRPDISIAAQGRDGWKVSVTGVLTHLKSNSPTVVSDYLQKMVCNVGHPALQRFFQLSAHVMSSQVYESRAT
jgi:hypothetical protein